MPTAGTIDIANRALQKLGVPRINSSALDGENSEAARTMNEMFVMVRDASLRAHPWNFAIRRCDLAATEATPSWGFDLQYELPADFLRMLEVRYATNGEEYRIENGMVLTNLAAPLYIRYVSRAEDPATWDPLFQEALACRLAWEAAPRLNPDPGIRQKVWAEYQLALEEAKSADGRDEGPHDFMPDDWELARY